MIQSPTFSRVTRVTTYPSVDPAHIVAVLPTRSDAQLVCEALGLICVYCQNDDRPLTDDGFQQALIRLRGKAFLRDFKEARFKSDAQNPQARAKALLRFYAQHSIYSGESLEQFRRQIEECRRAWSSNRGPK
jgi:hypothetical protein